MKKLFALLMVAMLSLAVFAAASAAQEVCNEGGDWSAHQDPPISDVGAVEYCIKYGTNVDYGTYAEVVAILDEAQNDLSHWSYRMGEPEPLPLKLTFMQPCEPIEGTPEQAEWRVRNPNGFAVEYDVWKAGTGYIMTDQSAPPGDSFFYTAWGTQTLKIEWDGGSNTKAGGDSFNGNQCEPEPVTCARCSNVAAFTWVEWTELDGDCENEVVSPNEDRVETYPSELCGAVFGCTDEAAVNYDPEANFDDQTCQYDLCLNLEGVQLEVPEGYVKLGPADKPGRCFPKPEQLTEVTVDVGMSCGPTAEDGIVYQTYFNIDVEPDDGAVVTYDGTPYAGDASGYSGFGTYQWSAVANEGFIIVGGDEGSVTVDREDCDQDPKKPPETGGADGLPFVAVGAVGAVGLAALGIGLYHEFKRAPSVKREE